MCLICGRLPWAYAANASGRQRYTVPTAMQIVKNETNFYGKEKQIRQRWGLKGERDQSSYGSRRGKMMVKEALTVEWSPTPLIQNKEGSPSCRGISDVYSNQAELREMLVTQWWNGAPWARMSCTSCLYWLNKLNGHWNVLQFIVSVLYLIENCEILF